MLPPELLRVQGFSFLMEAWVPISVCYSVKIAGKSLEHVMYEQEHQHCEKHSSPDLFSSLKLGILIIYFHQAVEEACIIDETMLYRVSEFLARPGLSSALRYSKKNILKEHLPRVGGTLMWEKLMVFIFVFSSVLFFLPWLHYLSTKKSWERKTWQL